MIEEKKADANQHNPLAERLIPSFSARVLHLDNLISVIMTQHFCSREPERAALLLHSIAPDTSFRTKINIFLNMMKIYHDVIFEKHELDLRKLYEIDQYRIDLAGLMASNPEGAEVQKEHESKTLLCIKLAAILNSIQRETAPSSLS
ncbi:MAG TPA: hypothetical protein VFG29_00155 [Syntrophales bacterium]|nr:hypothetical protein [Syntrophales bacterium]